MLKRFVEVALRSLQQVLALYAGFDCHVDRPFDRAELSQGQLLLAPVPQAIVHYCQRKLSCCGDVKVNETCFGARRV